MTPSTGFFLIFLGDEVPKKPEKTPLHAVYEERNF